MTLLVVPITVENAHQALAKAQLAKAGGADAVEYRVDRLADQPDLVQTVVADSPLPCIVTCRHACETGGFDGPEAQRIALYAALMSAAKAPMAVDVELAKWRAEPEWAKVLGPLLAAGRTKLILSAHDFNGRPVDLDKRLKQMLEEPLCDVPKLAWKAQGLEDCAIAMDFLKVCTGAGKPGVALAMGEAGMPSRILAKKGGAYMTFAALDQASGTAPGQPLLAEMKNLYRWDAIGKKTKVYGVIGCPVGHSMSPAIHNAGFSAVEFDGVYVPMRIEAGYENFARDLDAWIGCEGMDFSGASVTIPHKENLLRWGKEKKQCVEEFSERMGAANTWTATTLDGPMISNTDFRGISEAIDDVMAPPLGEDPMDGFQKTFWSKWEKQELRVAVIGAGGASRAAVAAFSGGRGDGKKQQVVIFNRSEERAKEIAEVFNVQFRPMEFLTNEKFDLLINCTPLGMTPNVDTSPLADNHPALVPGVVVFDTVYNPIETKLLKQAKAAGCICIPGTEMFLHQAAEQFALWTGRSAPLNIFRKVLMEKLGA